MKGPPVAHCQQCDASIEPGVLHQGSVFCGGCRLRAAVEEMRTTIEEAYEYTNPSVGVLVAPGQAELLLDALEAGAAWLDADDERPGQAHAERRLFRFALEDL